jgi:hypothetical protein
VKSGCNLAEPIEEGYGSYRAVLPPMMMTNSMELRLLEKLLIA